MREIGAGFRKLPESIAQRHHFVPKFVLRGFAVPRAAFSGGSEDWPGLQGLTQGRSSGSAALPLAPELCVLVRLRKHDLDGPSRAASPASSANCGVRGTSWGFNRIRIAAKRRLPSTTTSLGSGSPFSPGATSSAAIGEAALSRSASPQAREETSTGPPCRGPRTADSRGQGGALRPGGLQYALLGAICNGEAPVS